MYFRVSVCVLLSMLYNNGDLCFCGPVNSRAMFIGSGVRRDSLSNPYSERVSRLISEPGRSWARFPHSGTWPDSPSNLQSERVSRVISEPGRSWV
jgi:hypothetical protein